MPLHIEGLKETAENRREVVMMMISLSHDMLSISYYQPGLSVRVVPLSVRH
jgi:hypothetical protein